MKQLFRHSTLLKVVILVFCGTGAWVSGEMVKQHAGFWGANTHREGLFAFVCEAAATMGLGCSNVNASDWSDITLPLPTLSVDSLITLRRVSIPVAFLGLAYFLFLGVWYGLIGSPRLYGRPWHRVPFVVGMGGSAVSVFYLGVMAFGFAHGCLGCLIVHVMNLVMFWAMYHLRVDGHVPGLADASVISLPETMASITLTSREAKGIMACSLIMIAGLWIYRNERLALQARLDNLASYKAMVKSLQKDTNFLVREYLAQPQYEFPSRPTEATHENQSELVVFTDFQCGACYCKSKWIQKHITQVFKDKLAVRIRHFPLCGECNDVVPDSRHQDACQAAYAAEAARAIGGEAALGQMHDLLFENRKQLNERIYRQLAVQIGINPDRLDREMNSETVRSAVQSDIALAQKLEVKMTPTLFLNGRRVTPLCQTPRFWEIASEQPLFFEQDTAPITVSHSLPDSNTRGSGT